MADAQNPIDFFTALSLAAQKYPGIAPLLNHSDVAVVIANVMEAEARGQPMTPDQVQSALSNTAYYQATPASQRTWDVGMALDPATYQQKLADTGRTFYALEDQLGVLRGQLLPGLVQQAAAEGWDAQRMKYEILAAGVGAGGAVGANVPTLTGELGQNARQIKGLFSSYGVPMSDQDVMNWAVQVGQGRVDMNAMQGYAEEQARSLYPGLASAIDRGVTVAQYAAPYAQIASQELGVDPNQIDWADSKWNKAINTINPQTKDREAMSLADWTSTVRTDPTYGYDQTTQAQQQAASFATQLAQKMGGI